MRTPARGARKKRRRGREPAADDEPVRVIRSLGLDGATVSLPAGIDLERRAERTNAFWEALVQYQYQHVVVVVAVCATGARYSSAISQSKSASPPRADMCSATTHVRFALEADISPYSIISFA
jgi:hypothetical protein